MKCQDLSLPKLYRISSHSSVRSSISDGLMPKVPHQMRQSLKNHKLKTKSTLKLTSMYDQFKNVISREKDCAICLMKVTNGISLSNCQHTFCEQCLLNYLTYKINSMEQILCPEEGCNKKLDIRSQAYKNLPQKYQKLHRKQQLWHQTMKNPDIKLCPIETCNEGIINMRKVPPQCENCKTVFCQQCMMTQHQGVKCDENFKLNFKQWKRCTKCLMFIEKSQGCNHMVCRCNYEFCFICLQPWNNDHYSCVDRANMRFLNIEQTRYPKFFGFIMILLLPILLAFAVAVLAIGSVLSFGIGFCIGVYFCILFSIEWCFLTIIFLPIVAIIAGFIGFGWGTSSFFLSIIEQYAGQYFITLQRLWGCG